VSDSALLFHHGTTCAKDCWDMWLQGAAEAGVRAISYNRPGVDQSTRFEGRRVSNDIEDSQVLLAALGITKFVSVGWSGGGARAMGTGLLEGCVGVHTIAGIAQINVDDPETYIGLSDERMVQVRKNIASYAEVFKERKAGYEDDLKLTYEIAIKDLEGCPGFDQFEEDYKVFAQDFTNSIHKGLAQGPEIDADDFFANINFWGYSVSEVNVPVTIWHGTNDDGVSIERGEYNHKHLPDSTLIPLEGQNHVSIMVENRTEILAAAINDLLGNTLEG